MTRFNLVSREDTEEFKKLFTRGYPLSHLFFQLSSFEKYWRVFFKTKTNFAEVLRMISYDNGKTDIYFKVSKYHKLLNEIKANIEENPDYFKEVVEKTNNELKEANNLAENRKKYIEIIEKGNQNEILNTFLDYWNKCYKITVISWSFDIMGDALIERLIENYGYNEENIKILLSSGINTIFSEEKLAFLDVCKNFKGNDELFEKHLEKWAFMGMENPIAKPFTLEDLKTRYNHIYLKNIDEEIKKINQNFENGTKEVNNLFLHLSEEVRDAAEKIRIYMRYKNNERILLQKYVLDALEIFFKIFEVYGLPIKDYGFIFEYELIEVIKGELSKEELISRVESRKNKKYKVELKNSIKSVEEYDEKEVKHEKVNVLIGLTASKGVVKGRVKIIKDFLKDAHKLENGDILVTNMTTPDFIPLLEKVSAIITDEGGILCHAGIVSREFGIPCVVGTKNATNVLKDGDFVRVNALEKGTVEIIF